MEAILAFFHRRLANLPYGYPTTFAILADALYTIGAVGAVAQRGFDMPWYAWLALPLTWIMSIWFFCTGNMLNIVVATSTAILATALLVSSQHFPFDIAPLILVFTVSANTAMNSLAKGVGAALACCVFLLVAGRLGWVVGTPLLLCLVCTGWAVSYLMLTQQKLLLAERAMRTHLADQAATDERRRIAREVHDVIAHSLSVTMLHLTGARRVLQQDRDIDDAVAALVDAERLGRQAMADIRQTVGLLDDGQTKLTPEPGIRDITELVGDFTGAGLQVDYQLDGDLSHVSAAVGLGLYRIVQESLANVAKHAPTGNTAVLLHVSADQIDLSVVNDLPEAEPEPADGRCGSGLTGMRRRAEQLGGRLRAGREAAHWAVRAVIPLVAGATLAPDWCLLGGEA